MTAMEQAPAVSERQVVSRVWSHIEYLLTQGCDAFVSPTDTSASMCQQMRSSPGRCNRFQPIMVSTREVMQVLPDPSSFSSVDLPVLTKLHLSSAHNLMATLKLLAPAAFAAGSSQPDLNALDEADSSLLGMAATLIELQLFHLQRAAALTATTRKRLTQHGDGVHMGSWSVSGDSSSDASSNSQQMC